MQQTGFAPSQNWGVDNMMGKHATMAPGSGYGTSVLGHDSLFSYAASKSNIAVHEHAALISSGHLPTPALLPSLAHEGCPRS